MLVYGLSAADDVTFTGQGWDDFARRNAGGMAAAEAVVGRSLWDFVDGTSPRRFLERLFFDCRRSGEAATLVYRCDAPGVERLYCQHVLPARNGALRLESRLVRARRMPVAEPLLDGPWRRCSICLSASVDGAWWLPAARAAVGSTPAPVWTVCPACSRGALTRHPAAATAVPA